jgi:hypothetical protein
MLARLEEVDVSRLSAGQRVDYAVAIEKCLRQVEALRVRALAAAAGPQRGDPAREQGTLSLAGELRMSPRQTTHQVMLARGLVTDLADTLTLVENGKIPLAHARRLYEETAALTPEQTRAVEAAVLPGAADRTPYQHTEAIRRAVKKVAPRPGPDEPGSPEAQRRAEVRPTGPWSMGLWAEGPTDKMWTLAARLAQATWTPIRSGDSRTVEQARFDALFDLVVHNTTVRVDLVGYVNPDGTISLPSLPGMDELNPDDLAKLMAGGTVRYHDPDRKPPATEAYAWTEAQRRYLCARDRRCRFPGCRVPAERCELDHVVPFSAGGATDVDNGLTVCKRHHRVKHQPDWKTRRFTDHRVEWTTPTGHVLTDHPWNRELV